MRLEPFAGLVGFRAVGQVTAGVEAHAEDWVAGLDQGGEDGLVGLAAGGRLDVGELAAEQLLGAVDGEGFDFVHKLAAAIVTLARVTFGVLVGQDRALGLEDGAGNDVLGRDKLDFVSLAAEFFTNPFGDYGVGFRKAASEKPFSKGARLAHRRDSTGFGTG